jgi:hypothetical protein
MVEYTEMSSFALVVIRASSGAALAFLKTL